MVISESLATHRAVKIVGMLAASAVLIASTAVQFAPRAGEESVNNSAVEKPEAILKSADLGGVDPEFRFMDLEDEPLSVEFLRTYVYPEERPSRSEAPSSHKQEIERLEGEISTLLDKARQDPSTDPLELDRDLRNLDYQIDMLRLAAMEQQ